MAATIIFWDRPALWLAGISLVAFPAGGAYVQLRELIAKGPVLVIGKDGIYSRRIGPILIPWREISAVGVSREGLVTLLRIAAPNHEGYESPPYWLSRLVRAFSIPISMRIDELDRSPAEILEAVGRFYVQSETEAQDVLDRKPSLGILQIGPLIWIGNLFGLLGEKLSLRQEMMSAWLWGFLLLPLAIILLDQALGPLSLIESEQHSKASAHNVKDLVYGISMLLLGCGLIWRARRLRQLYSESIPSPSDTEGAE